MTARCNGSSSQGGARLALVPRQHCPQSNPSCLVVIGLVVPDSRVSGLRRLARTFKPSLDTSAGKSDIVSTDLPSLGKVPAATGVFGSKIVSRGACSSSCRCTISSKRIFLVAFSRRACLWPQRRGPLSCLGTASLVVSVTRGSHWDRPDTNCGKYEKVMLGATKLIQHNIQYSPLPHAG